MNAIRQALAELIAAKDRYFEHTDPVAAIAGAYHRVIHAITVDFEALANEFAHLKERVKVLEANVTHVAAAPAIATDVSLAPVPPAPTPPPPLPVPLPTPLEVTTPVKATAPGAPIIGSAVADDRRATVAFLPPESDGGSPITGYTVAAFPLGVTMTGTGSPIDVLDLVNGTSYRFTVTAHNDIGAGPASELSNVVTPMTPEERALLQAKIDAGIAADARAVADAQAAAEAKANPPPAPEPVVVSAPIPDAGAGAAPAASAPATDEGSAPVEKQPAQAPAASSEKTVQP